MRTLIILLALSLSGCAHYEEHKTAYWVAGGILVTSVALSEGDGKVVDPVEQRRNCFRPTPSGGVQAQAC